MKPVKFEYYDGVASSLVTLIDKPDFLDYPDIADQLYSKLPQTTNMTEIFIVRPPVDQPITHPERLKHKLKQFLDRMPNASIHTLTSNDFRISLSKNINPNTNSILESLDSRRRFLSWLRQEELRRFVSDSSALFSAKNNMVFWTPSGRYVKNFLRVGSIQTSRRVIDTIFFWAIPHLSGCTGIVCETWSISSIALNMARMLERYGRQFDLECKVDMLSQYHTGYSGHEDIKDAVDRVSKSQGHVLFLISCVMTGASLSALRNTVATYISAERSSFLALYRLNETIEIETLCDYFGRDSDPKFDGAQRRHPGDSVISMDRHTYFPLYIKERRLGIYKSDVQGARPFFDLYRGRNVVSVHRTVLDMNGMPGRHHGIYLDVLSLLQTDEFKQKLDLILAEINRSPKLIVCPPHDAGIALRQYVAHFFEATAEEIVELTSSDLGGDIDQKTRGILSDAAADDLIIIVDDVSISGNRLARYSKRLRELNFQGRVIYIVGVARPENATEWSQRKIHLCHRQDGCEQHQVFSVETVYVPDWNSDSCPWCEELKILDNSLQDLAGSGERAGLEVLEDRIKCLTKVRESGGLVNDVIWSGNCGSVQLTRNSIFIGSSNATQADVFAVVASCIQNLRSVGRDGNKMGVSFPNANVLNPKQYLHQIFSDLILRAAIVRTSVRSELEMWTEDGRTWRQEAFTKLILENETESCLLEFAVDVLLHRLPSPKVTSQEIAAIITSPNRLLQNPPGWEIFFFDVLVG